MAVIDRARRAGVLFFRCDFFLLVLEVCFAPSLDAAVFFGLCNFCRDGDPGFCFDVRRGFNFKASVVTVNPVTGSRLIDVLISRSMAANFLCS